MVSQPFVRLNSVSRIHDQDIYKSAWSLLLEASSKKLLRVWEHIVNIINREEQENKKKKKKKKEIKEIQAARKEFDKGNFQSDVPEEDFLEKLLMCFVSPRSPRPRQRHPSPSPVWKRQELISTAHKKNNNKKNPIHTRTERSTNSLLPFTPVMVTIIQTFAE